jgi:hypothetical protein
MIVIIILILLLIVIILGLFNTHINMVEEKKIDNKTKE